MAERTRKSEIAMNSPDAHIERTKELGYCFSRGILCIGTALRWLWRLGRVNGA